MPVGELFRQPNLARLYHLNGNSTDDSGNGANGTDSNMSYTAYGKFSNAGSFNGSNSRVTFTTPSISTGAFSVLGWFKTTQTTTGNVVFLGNPANTTSWSARFGQVVAGEFRCSYSSGTGATVVTGLNDDKWHCFVYTAASGTGAVKLYIDGQLRAVGTSSSDSIDTGNGSLGYRTDNQWPFSGTIDEVGIFTTELKQKFIAEYYQWAVGRMAKVL